jgi:hypothetical protein
MVSRPFELFDVSGKALLQKVDPIANVPSEFLGKRAELLAHFFRNEQRIGHKGSVTEISIWPSSTLVSCKMSLNGALDSHTR